MPRRDYRECRITLRAMTVVTKASPTDATEKKIFTLRARLGSSSGNPPRVKKVRVSLAACLV
jgi:ribosomal protein L29